MNIAGSKAFLAVVSAKSISKAAEALYLTQSTVSFQLKMLEEELGVTLIERKKGHRQIELTQKGQEFVSIAERHVQIDTEARALRYKNKVGLLISSVDSLNIYTFAPFYQQLLHGDPPFQLRVFTHQTPEIYEQIENRAVDIGFVLHQKRYPNIIMKPITQEAMFYVRAARGDNSEQDQSPIHSKQLPFEKEIFFNWGPEFSHWHNSWCNPGVQTILQVDTITMLMLFLKDDYWAILPEGLIDVLKERHALCCRPIIEGPPDRICYKLVHRFPRLTRQPYINLFEERLESFLREPL